MAGRLFWQLMSGVEHLHQLKIAHLGINPMNLLFDEHLNLKLVNFSQSVEVDEKEQISSQFDSLESGLLSPEALRGESYDPLKSDIWSCGVVFYFILTRTLPFEGLEMEEMKQRIEVSDILYPSYLSDGAKKLLKRLLNPNPKSRPGIDEAMESEWMQLNKPKSIPTSMKRVEVNTAALLKMSANFKVDKKFHQTMIDSLMENQKNWLTAK